MSVTVTFTTLTADEAAAESSPVFPFTFVTGGSPAEVFGSDTLTGICEALIDGYADLPEVEDGYDAHLDARIGMLAGLANGLQAASIAALEEDGALNLTEDELTAVMHPKDAEVLEFEEWTSNTPLLLLATNYAPYTEVIPPEGDAIVWLNPHDERTFLMSLHRLGIGQLWVNSEVAFANTPAEADGV